MIRERKVVTYPVGYVLLGRCRLELAAAQAAKTPPSRKLLYYRKSANAFARRFTYGLVEVTRMSGTLSWLQGKHQQAERQWGESLAVAGQLGADYEAGLTHIERGRRTGNGEEVGLGEQMIARCKQNVDLASLLALADAGRAGRDRSGASPGDASGMAATP